MPGSSKAAAGLTIALVFGNAFGRAGARGGRIPDGRTRRDVRRRHAARRAVRRRARRAVDFYSRALLRIVAVGSEIASLAPAHDIYAVTLPGFDGRPRDRGTDLMNRAVASLSELVRTRRLNHPIVIGHSLGGTLAVLFAERYPQEPGAIVAVEGGYPVAATQAQREKIAAAAAKPYYGADAATFARVLRKNQLQYVITSKTDVDTVSRYADRAIRRQWHSGCERRSPWILRPVCTTYAYRSPRSCRSAKRSIHTTGLQRFAPNDRLTRRGSHTRRTDISS